MLEQLTRQLAESRDLTDADVKAAVEQLVDEAILLATKADFLCALTKKGETPTEIAAFVREMRSRSVQPPIDPNLRHEEILDVVGTGGDRLSTFNISTTVALLRRRRGCGWPSTATAPAPRRSAART